MDFMSALQQTNNLTKTENGALGFESTLNPLLDFNFKISEYRNMMDYGDVDTPLKDWFKVLLNDKIDPKIAVKYAFFLRDPRAGLGERRLGRICISAICEEYPDLLLPLTPLMAEYGRWDDIVFLLEMLTDMTNPEPQYVKVKETIERIIRLQWTQDLHNMHAQKEISLMAKWLPSINSHSTSVKQSAIMIRKVLHISEKQYRLALSLFRKYLNIIEVNLSSKEYDRINYSQVPSKAALLYRQAFLRHDEDRYKDYLNKLSEGSEKVNASVTAPYEIVHEYCKNLPWWDYTNLHTDTLLEEAWKKIPCEDISDTLVVRDGSGSMTCKVGANTITALDIATSLAIFFSEHNKGQFKDKFITFSSRPKFIDLSTCKDLRSKLITCYNEDDCSNTNLEKTFQLILNTAVQNNLKQEDLPKNILIVSDMQFDYATTNSNSKTLIQHIGEDFAKAGYVMPRLVFWNVIGGNARTTVFPEVRGNICLLSGFSQNNYKMIMSGNIDPWSCLLEVLNTPRYKAIDEAWELAGV